MTTGRLRVGPFVRALACVALLLSLLGCGAQETALRIGTNVWIGGEPLYLARELGRFDPAAVQLVEYPSASEVMRAFRNQAIDGKCHCRNAGDFDRPRRQADRLMTES